MLNHYYRNPKIEFRERERDARKRERCLVLIKSGVHICIDMFK